MKQCPRCYRWHRTSDSDVCDVCWKELGQMELDLQVDYVPAVDAEDDEYEPLIDSVFDRMAERENRFP